MKTYSLQITDSEGIIVLERGIAADQVVDMLLEEPKQEKEPVVEPEEEKPAVKKRRGRKPKAEKLTGKRQIRCSHCGQPGHQSRTCPGTKAREKDLVAEIRSDKAKKYEESIEARVRDLHESGCSFDEMLVAMPSIPAFKISEVYERIKQEG